MSERTPASLVVERCREVTIVLTNKAAFPRKVIDALPRLRCISVLVTGYNVINGGAAIIKGMVVCNVPGYVAASVVQHVFASLL